MNKLRDEKTERGEALYEGYGKPLEAEHWGEYLAIAPDGRTLLASTLRDAVERAHAAFGSGSFVFRVGPRAVGRI